MLLSLQCVSASESGLSAQNYGAIYIYLLTYLLVTCYAERCIAMTDSVRPTVRLSTHGIVSKQLKLRFMACRMPSSLEDTGVTGL